MVIKAAFSKSVSGRGSPRNIKTPAGGKDKNHMDKEQLGNLILASSESMYRVAKTLLRDDGDCQDAMQEAIVKAFAKVDTLRRDSLAKTWLIRIVINECYTLLRGKQKLVFLEDYPQQEKTREDRDYSELYEALEQLPDPYRICVTLYYLEGYSVKEIGAMLEVPESTVKNRLSRARMRMRRELEHGKPDQYGKSMDEQEADEVKRDESEGQGCGTAAG